MVPYPVYIWFLLDHWTQFHISCQHVQGKISLTHIIPVLSKDHAVSLYAVDSNKECMPGRQGCSSISPSTALWGKNWLGTNSITLDKPKTGFCRCVGKEFSECPWRAFIGNSSSTGRSACNVPMTFWLAANKQGFLRATWCSGRYSLTASTSCEVCKAVFDPQVVSGLNSGRGSATGCMPLSWQQ